MSTKRAKIVLTEREADVCSYILNQVIDHLYLEDSFDEERYIDDGEILINLPSDEMAILRKLVNKL
jgi:hypothetical protein